MFVDQIIKLKWAILKKVRGVTELTADIGVLLKKIKFILEKIRVLHLWPQLSKKWTITGKKLSILKLIACKIC